MPDFKWRNPRITPGDALLLLPYLPRGAQVLEKPDRWLPALAGVEIKSYVEGDCAPSMVIGASRAAAAVGAELVLATDGDRRRSLRRAGYRTRTFLAQPGPAGAVLIVAAPDGGGRRSINPSGKNRTLRQHVVAMVRRASGRSYVTVGHRGTTMPAAVQAAVKYGPEQFYLIAGGGGSRRRSAFVVRSGQRSMPDTVIKVGFATSEDRGIREQQVLRELGEAGVRDWVPLPLGHGHHGPLYWSAESSAAGVPLADLLAGARRWPDIAGTLDLLVRRFTELGVATRSSLDVDDVFARLPLRGDHRQLSRLRENLVGVPGIVVHGDVASAFNVLVHRQQVAVIDWETSLEAALPLTDLLPLLCNALAALVGRSADHSGAYVLDLCAGKDRHSKWLFDSIRSYCCAVGVPLSRSGALGALAWGYQASMRLVHEEQVARTGAVMRQWRTSADAIARGWLEYPELGLEWSALTAGAA